MHLPIDTRISHETSVSLVSTEQTVFTNTRHGDAVRKKTLKQHWDQLFFYKVDVTYSNLLSNLHRFHHSCVESFMCTYFDCHGWSTWYVNILNFPSLETHWSWKMLEHIIPGRIIAPADCAHRHTLISCAGQVRSGPVSSLAPLDAFAVTDKERASASLCLVTVASFTISIWLVVWTPLKNISQLGWLFPIYGKIKNVPNHQPAIRIPKT